MKRVILLADDSATIQRLVAQTFADSSVEVVAVSNGDAAIRKFDELRPQLVLTDIYMPGKNGYEVCAYIKNHSELSATPVVLLAGAFDAFDEGTAQKVGAAAHITKPFEPRALVDLVMSLIREATESAPVRVPEPVPIPVPVQESEPDARPELPLEANAEPMLDTATESRPEPVGEPMAATVTLPVRENVPMSVGTTDAFFADDLLGLGELFQPAGVDEPSALSVSDEEIERIADRVIQKLTTQVIESVAWDVVPGITSKVLREELKRQS